MFWKGTWGFPNPVTRKADKSRGKTDIYTALSKPIGKFKLAPSATCCKAKHTTQFTPSESINTCLLYLRILNSIKLYQHIRVSSCIPHFLSISHFLSIYLSISLSPSLKADFCTLYHPFHHKQDDSFIVISFASFLFLQRSFVRSRSSSISEAIYVNCGLC